jgi:hypothetical protein
VIKTTGVVTHLQILAMRSTPTGRAWPRGKSRQRFGDRGAGSVLAATPHLGCPGTFEKDFVGWGTCLADMEDRHGATASSLFRCGRGGRKPHVSGRKKLHTAQPSLSRQIRDLEFEVGVPLISRSVHGVELTAAGKAILDHARLTLAQGDAAVEAARRAAQPARKSFAIGFQTDHEMNWLPRVMHVLREELKNIQVTPFKNVYSLLQQGLTSEKRARTDMRDD